MSHLRRWFRSFRAATFAPLFMLSGVFFATGLGPAAAKPPVPSLSTRAGDMEAVDCSDGITFRAIIKNGITTVTRTGRDGRKLTVSPRQLPANEALLVAILLHDHNRAKALLARNPTLAKGRISTGTTPLHQAAFHADPIIAALLLTRGAVVNARDAGGTTPLALASDDSTRALLKRHGASL